MSLRRRIRYAYYRQLFGVRSRDGQETPDQRQAFRAEPGVAASAEKSIISIRMPVEVLRFVEDESRARGAALGLKGPDLETAINITAQINRTLEALRSWFGLPAIVAESVEKDRAALGLGRLEYLQYLVFRRYEGIVKNGPGFDRDSPPERARR